MLTLFRMRESPKRHVTEPNRRDEGHGPDPQDHCTRRSQVVAEEDLTGSARLGAFLVLTALPLAAALPASAQLPRAVNGEDLADASGEAIYAASCANCHGLDGLGVAPSLLAFEEEVPDFTDCDFAAREPDGDWIAVAHEGGPVRGFSEMMPAFRGALTEEQLGRVMGYIRTLCTDDNWPRGELNLPRPLLTEKAYPEDEWVVEAAVDLESGGGFTGAYVYEQRFGPRSQVEVVIPYGWLPKHAEEPAGEHDHDHGESHDGEGRRLGLGDFVVGLKHALHHDLETGTIFSVGGEAILSTGDADTGLGAPGSALEAFAAFAKLLPDDSFVQAQTGLEAPSTRTPHSSGSAASSSEGASRRASGAAPGLPCSRRR